MIDQGLRKYVAVLLYFDSEKDSCLLCAITIGITTWRLIDRERGGKGGESLRCKTCKGFPEESA